jgi:hypothetical protein
LRVLGNLGLGHAELNTRVRIRPVKQEDLHKQSQTGTTDIPAVQEMLARRLFIHRSRIETEAVEE